MTAACADGDRLLTHLAPPDPGLDGAVAAAWPALPYPGTRPKGSYALVDSVLTALVPDPAAPSGWVTRRGEDLDRWLAERGGVSLAARTEVLAYGSNVNPSKLSLMRVRDGLSQPVVVLRAVTDGLAAAWCASTRADGAVPATLVAAAGVIETHAVLPVDPSQLAALDRCEGRPSVYRLVRLGAGRVVVEDGHQLREPLTYLAAGGQRGAIDDGSGAPLLASRCPQQRAQEIVASGRARCIAGWYAAGLHPVEVPD